jgi:glycosyltransferase 2 family protein
MWWLLARLAISGGLLAWLVHGLNLATIGQRLLHANVGWLLAANLITAPVIVLVSWKWQILLRAAGVRERLWRLIRMNLVGGFYSLVLPGEETGQLVKGVILARHSKGDAVAASIVVDEILGTLSIFAIALVALAVTSPFPLRLPIAGALIFMLLVFLVLLVLAVLPRFHGLAQAIIARGLPWLIATLVFVLVPQPVRGRFPHAAPGLAGRLEVTRSRFVSWLQPFWDRLRLYHRQPGPLLAAFAITVAAHLVANVSVMSTMRAAGVGLDYLNICWFVAAVSALVTIPITVSGFGIREGANVILLAQFQVGREQALVVSTLAFAIGFIWSLPGAVLQFGIRSKGPARQPAEPEGSGSVEAAAGSAAR